MSEKDRPRTDRAEHARLQKALRESVILRELADILNSSLDLEHILQELVKRTTELCEVPRCAFWQLEEAGERLLPTTYYLASSVLSSKKRKAADAIWYRGHLSISNPIITGLLDEGGVLSVEDLRAEPTLQHLAHSLNASAGIAMLLAPGEADLLQPACTLSQEMHEHLDAIGLSLDDLPNFWLAIHTGLPLLVTAELAQDQEVEWFHRFGLKYMLLVPLMGGSPPGGANWDLPGTSRILRYTQKESLLDIHCPGLIVLHYTRRRKPTSGEYAFAQDIAAQCALAIEKARLLAEAREAAILATERASTLDAVFQAMSEGITVVTSSDEQVSFSNHAVARFLGVPVYSRLPLKTFLEEHPAYTLDGH